LGKPEKIGGWEKDTGSAVLTDTGTGSTLLAPPTGSFWGVCRSLWNWLNLESYNLVGLGTNLKFYIQNSANGSFYDVTPIRASNAIASNAFTTVNGSTTVTVNNLASSTEPGDFVILSGVASAVNGIPAADLNREFRVVSVLAGTAFTITVATAATSSGTTGACTVDYETETGGELVSSANGWSAGGWGGVTAGFTNTGWGESAATGFAIGLRVWSQSNFGENLLFNARGGAINFWAVNTAATVFDRGQVVVAGGTVTIKNYSAGSGTVSIPIDATCPSQVNYLMVSDASRFTPGRN